jgi:hypothetical protein
MVPRRRSNEAVEYHCWQFRELTGRLNVTPNRLKIGDRKGQTFSAVEAKISTPRDELNRMLYSANQTRLRHDRRSGRLATESTRLESVVGVTRLTVVGVGRWCKRETMSSHGDSL